MFHRFNIWFFYFLLLFSPLTGRKVYAELVSICQQTAHVANPWFCLLALWVLGKITLTCPCLEDSFHSRAACKFPEICFCFVLFLTNIYLLRFCWTTWGFLKNWFSGSLKDKTWQRIFKKSLSQHIPFPSFTHMPHSTGEDPPHRKLSSLPLPGSRVLPGSCRLCVDRDRKRLRWKWR